MFVSIFLKYYLRKNFGSKDFFKLRLGNDNTREIIWNYFETIKCTLIKNKHFVFKKYKSSLLSPKKILMGFTKDSTSHLNLIARYTIFLLRKSVYSFT